MANERHPVCVFRVAGMAKLKESIYRAASVLRKAIRFAVACNKATSKELHYMKYSKKKRIRKKYLNRALKRARQKTRED